MCEYLKDGLEPPVSNSAIKDELYYLQNGVVGNDMLFWRKDGEGYTTNLEEAEVFTKKEAFSLSKENKKYKPRLKAEVDQCSHHSTSMSVFTKKRKD